MSTLPSLEMPPALARALSVRDDRARDLAEAQEALHATRAQVEVARVEDVSAFAAARDQGDDDPGPARERAAREHVVDCERRERGEAMRLARAEHDLAAAVAEHVDDWAARLAKVWAKLDAASLAAVQKLADAEAKRAEVRQVAQWIGHVQATGDLDQRMRSASTETSLRDASSSNAHLRVEQVVDALRAFVEATSAQTHELGAGERIAARERDARLLALRRHENREAQAASMLVAVGELELEEAEAVAAGVPLAEVEQAARRRKAEARPQPVGPWG